MIPKVMQTLRTLIILAHPAAALVILWLFFNQRKWRKKSLVTKGSERERQIQNHESMGNNILIYSILIVLLAFISNIFRGIIDFNSPTYYLIPGHFHGWSGILGLIMMFGLWNLGKKTSLARKSGSSFHRQKEIHGRVSDILAMLIVIHSFLGLLYLLSIL